MSTQRPFRAVIIGGGPCGLFLASCLSAANIDYVVLERRPTPVEASGSGFGIWPQGTRVLAQLGLLEDLEKLTSPTGETYQLNPDGSILGRFMLLPELEKAMGFSYMTFNRAEFCQVLYDHLPEKSKVKTGQKVVSVEQGQHFAKVILADGTEEVGDVVIGCDGVYSAVRKFVVDKDDETALIAVASNKNQQMYTSGYRCLYGTSAAAGRQNGEMIITFGEQASYQDFVVKDKCLWILYEKLPETTTERISYTQSEEIAFAENYLDIPVDARGHKFREVWEQREQFKAGILQEGVYKSWYKGRVVLVGDAAHRMTPNLAHGYNAAIQGATSLANQLYDLLHSTPNSSKSPSTLQVEAAFKKYQDYRFPLALASVKKSAMHTRLCAWDTPMIKYTTKLIGAIFPTSLIVRGTVAQERSGLCLTFLEKPSHGGWAKFDDEIEVSDKRGLVSINAAVVAAGVAVILAGFLMTVNQNMGGTKLP